MAIDPKVEIEKALRKRSASAPEHADADRLERPKQASHGDFSRTRAAARKSS
jgi:hypothetical protein